MQRAVMTMPPGAGCLLANTFSLMRGLHRGYQRRRTTAAERADYRYFHDVLDLNLGSGYFSFDRFTEGPNVQSDASKSTFFRAKKLDTIRAFYTIRADTNLEGGLTNTLLILLQTQAPITGWLIRDGGDV